RRRGRTGPAAAVVGPALSGKPIRHGRDGEIAGRDRVRTTSRALDRLVDLAVSAAGDGEVDIAGHHFVAEERARAVTAALLARLGPRVRRHWVSEVGAVVAAHAGPGLAGVVVHRRA